MMILNNLIKKHYEVNIRLAKVDQMEIILTLNDKKLRTLVSVQADIENVLMNMEERLK